MNGELFFYSLIYYYQYVFFILHNIIRSFSMSLQQLVCKRVLGTFSRLQLNLFFCQDIVISYPVFGIVPGVIELLLYSCYAHLFTPLGIMVSSIDIQR